MIVASDLGLDIPGEDRTATDAVRWTDKSLVLHSFDHPGCPVVSDPEATLQHRRRGGSVLADDG